MENYGCWDVTSCRWMFTDVSEELRLYVHRYRDPGRLLIIVASCLMSLLF
jgi:hypothetical protein